MNKGVLNFATMPMDSQLLPIESNNWESVNYYSLYLHACMYTKLGIKGKHI